MAQPYDVYIFLGLAAILVAVLYTLHFCCSCVRQPSANAACKGEGGVELAATNDDPPQGAPATASEQSRLTDPSDIHIAGKSTGFRLVPGSCHEGMSTGRCAAHLAGRVAFGT